MIHLLPSGCEYVNIPKCGSQSIRAALGIKAGDKYSGTRKRHGRVSTLYFNGAKYVAIVRDPLKRFISCVSFLNRNYDTNYDYETWIAMDGRYPTRRMEHHLRPQIEFIQDPSKFHRIYDITEIGQFFTDHGLKPYHENKNTSPEMEMTPEIIEWVHSKYREDYEMLGEYFKN